jgi:hypothetical protein
MPTISGTVLDDTGTAVAGRIVRAYRRDTGALLTATVTSDGEAPVDADFASVSLLLHMDGANGSTTFTDSSDTPKTVTRFGDAQISTAQSKFGGASGYFDGTGDYLEVSPDIELLNSAFTLECWIRTSQTLQYAPIASRYPSAWGSGMWAFYFNATTSAGNLQFWAHNFSSGSPLMTTTGVSVIDNEWHHIALVRSAAGAWAIYVDGVSRATATWTGTIADIAAQMRIGNDQAVPARVYSGYMDEFRLTIGAARYTANFTPPTAPFPNTGVSLALGEYQINTAHTGECNVVCLDDAGGTTYNDLILRTTPV